MIVTLVVLHSNHHAGRPHWPSLNLTLCFYQMHLYNKTCYPPSKAALQILMLSMRCMLVSISLATWASTSPARSAFRLRMISLGYLLVLDIFVTCMPTRREVTLGKNALFLVCRIIPNTLPSYLIHLTSERALHGKQCSPCPSCPYQMLARYVLRVHLMERFI